MKKALYLPFLSLLILTHFLFVFPQKSFASTASKILFFNNSNMIYSINPDGTGLTYLAAGLYPKMSPDGKKIAYLKYVPVSPSISCPGKINEGDIFTMNPDGSDVQDLTYGLYCLANNPTCTSDSKKIIFSDSPQKGVINIDSMNADGTNNTTILNNTRGSVSPNGTKIAYMPSDTEIDIANIDGSNRIQIPHVSYIIPGLIWSPDGTKIVFTSYGVTPESVDVINSDGTNLTTLYSTANSVSNPVWSPDGTKIAFTEYASNSESIDIINSDGTSLIPFEATGAVSQLSWSPDGTEIAFPFYDGNLDIFCYMNDNGQEGCAESNGLNILDIVTAISTQIYTPILNQDDSYSVQGGDWYSIVATNTPPTVGTVSTTPSPAQINTSVTVSAPFTDPDTSDTHTAIWNWGDGSALQNGMVTESNGSGSVTDTHIYTAPGSYTVTLKVTDNGGLNSSSSAVVAVAPAGGFNSSNLSGDNYSGADLSGQNISNSNLKNAIFDNANLSNTNLSGSNLSMSGASFIDANFTSANVTSSNLSLANFTGANFTNAILINANSKNANLTNVNFTRADLTGSNLTGATITGITWSNTICPNGTNSDNDSGTCIGQGGGL